MIKHFSGCGCVDCRQERVIKTLADVVKNLDMTDKQILSACKPKPLYYSNTQVRSMARACIVCSMTVKGKFSDLESHAEQNCPPTPGRRTTV